MSQSRLGQRLSHPHKSRRMKSKTIKSGANVSFGLESKLHGPIDVSLDSNSDASDEDNDEDEGEDEDDNNLGGPDAKNHNLEMESDNDDDDDDDDDDASLLGEAFASPPNLTSAPNDLNVAASPARVTQVGALESDDDDDDDDGVANNELLKCNTAKNAPVFDNNRETKIQRGFSADHAVAEIDENMLLHNQTSSRGIEKNDLTSESNVSDCTERDDNLIPAIEIAKDREKRYWFSIFS